MTERIAFASEAAMAMATRRTMTEDRNRVDGEPGPVGVGSGGTP